MEWWLCSETVSAELSRGSEELFRLSLRWSQNYRGQLQFPTGDRTFGKCRSAGCIHVDACFLQTQIGTCRDAFKMQLRKYTLDYRIPFSLLLFSLCHVLTLLCQECKWGQHPQLLQSHYGQNPKLISFKCKKWKRKDGYEGSNILSKQGQCRELQLSLGKGMKLAMVQINIMHQWNICYFCSKPHK